MIDFILELLIDFGLLRSDIRHQKQISKKEREDGVKRPLHRFFLQPSSIVVILVFIIGSLAAFLFFNYQKTSIFPKKTKNEILEISDRIKKWNEKFGQYPKELNELIGKNPIRQDWIKDAWKKPYKYTVIKNGTGFLITSAGSDGQFGTQDDIKSE